MSLHEDLKAFVDQQLPPQRMAEIAEAVAADPALAREVDQLRQISSVLQAHAPEIPVKGLDSTLSALNRRTGRPAWVRWIPATGLAAVLIVFVLPMALMPIFGQSKIAAKRVALQERSADFMTEPASSMEEREMAKASSTLNAAPVRNRAARALTKAAPMPEMLKRPEKTSRPVSPEQEVKKASVPLGKPQTPSRDTLSVPSAPVAASAMAAKLPVAAVETIEVDATNLEAAEAAVRKVAASMGMVSPKLDSGAMDQVSSSSKASVPALRQVTVAVEPEQLEAFKKEVAKAIESLEKDGSKVGERAMKDAPGAGGVPGDVQSAQQSVVQRQSEQRVQGFGGAGGGNGNQLRWVDSQKQLKSETQRAKSVVITIRLRPAKPPTP